MSGFQASTRQRVKCKEHSCAVCAAPTVDPAHLIPRSMGGCDHQDCVVPLCRFHHDRYDREGFDLLPAVEKRFRKELAHAVGHVGLVAALTRISNTRWAPVGSRS